MRAYLVGRSQRPGFDEIDSPAAPGADELLLTIRACGLNFADLLMIKGEYQDTPEPPFAPGMEICGDVTAVGAEVTGFAVGDRVSAFCGSGGLAEALTVDAARCRKVPDAMPDTVAAGFQIAYGTSHLALTRRARLAAGETLVVLGAAGGVGLTAVELGKALGAVSLPWHAERRNWPSRKRPERMC